MHFQLLPNIITFGIIVCIIAYVEGAESSNAPGAGSSNDTAISEKKPYDVSFFSGNKFFSSVLLPSSVCLFHYFLNKKSRLVGNIFQTKSDPCFEN